MVKSDSVWEKDFAEKNRRAVKGVSESEEEFQRRNKKAVQKLEKNKSWVKFLGWFTLFICLIYVDLIISNRLDNIVVKYFAFMFFLVSILTCVWVILK